MQRLARQALSNERAAEEGTDESSLLRNPLDDLKDEFSSPSSSFDWDSSAQTTSQGNGTTLANNDSARHEQHANQDALSSWAAWNSQPPWHRDVTQIERVTGVARKTFLSYYSNAIHPRRLFLLRAAMQRPERGLLHNIVAAVPLMSLRNL